MTLSSFKTYLKRDFKRTDKDTEIVQAINDMIVWVSLQMPAGNYKYQSWINTVIRQEDYPIPTTAIHLIHPVRLLLGSNSADSGYVLTHVSKQEYDQLEPNPNRTNPTTGRPYAYTVYSRSILLTSIPDSAAYLLEINWSRRPTSLSADTDTPTLGSEWDETLKAGSLERLYAGLGLLQEASYWASQYRDAEGMPVGVCRTLLGIERDREETIIGSVMTNDL